MSIDKRLGNIKKLGELVPQLREKVYKNDYYQILKLYKYLINDPKSADFGFMNNYVENLRSVAVTAELYRTQEESRKLLLNAVSILEDIIRN